MGDEPVVASMFPQPKRPEPPCGCDWWACPDCHPENDDETT